MMDGFRIFFILFFLNLHYLNADNFKYNSYNNHGVIGIINMPSARFYNEGSFGVSIYDGTPDQKVTVTSNPYNWLEASFFYTNIQNRRYCEQIFDPVCAQDYKDKGFNFKIKLKEEGVLPAIAIGVNDIAGTGYYSSEYIVGSYGINKLDIHFGLGWGMLNGTNDFKNPLAYLDKRFNIRPLESGQGGQFQPSRYFSNEKIANFYGISYVINENILIKAERDTTRTDLLLKYPKPFSTLSYGIDFAINNNFTIGVSKERDSYFSIKFIYKAIAASSKPQYEYKAVENDQTLDEYGNLIKKLEFNGIGVNKIVEGANSIGLELTQFTHPNLDIIEEIVYQASNNAGIEKEIKTEYRIANLQAVSNYDNSLKTDPRVIYSKNNGSSFNTSNKITLRPFFAAREGFFKLAVLAENDSEYVFSDNLFFSSNVKYSIADNFDDLTIPPVDTYPAQVRSDVKDYLRNLDHPVIGRAQLDYHYTFSENNHLMFSSGILEEMFAGYGFEYLYFDNNKDYALGFEVFHVKKRDYEMQFGTLDYKTTTGSINLFYRNYRLIPFDAKISFGKYLAGDNGATFEFSRTYRNGAKFGVFATFTDVSSEQFGEGTFDKGLFFSIPVYKNLVDYSWRPLTKDPGAKLIRKHTLHDLLVKFRPFNQ